MDINQLYAEFCNKFWIYFLGTESAKGRKTATFKLWKDRIPAARKAMLQFLNEHGAPDKAPLFWVQDYPEPEPTNYNGSPDLNRTAENNEMVVAIYCEVAGIYTRQDAEDYGMQILRPFKIQQ
ncbi:MAG: hypothetical protein J6P74_00370 [Paludibacteraceae bacterium]|nr:hypothetical protein [Paludibacteraceae bacterium]